MKDKITLIKKDGSTYENIASSVQGNMIYTADANHPLEDGDTYQRALPSGVVEEYLVQNSGYQSGIGSISAHYQSKVKKKSALQEQKPLQNITYNVSGTNSRVNINSIDNSQNISENDVSKLFEEVFNLIKTIEGSHDRDCLQASAKELQDCYGKSSFLEKYQSFMATAANHMAVLAPVLPALAKLI